MTAEVLGTLVGAAIQGQIVASAHTLKHCLHHNLSANHLGNSSGAEVVRSLALSQDFLSHAVRVTVTTTQAADDSGTDQGQISAESGPDVSRYVPNLLHSETSILWGMLNDKVTLSL